MMADVAKGRIHEPARSAQQQFVREKSISHQQQCSAVPSIWSFPVRRSVVTRDLLRARLLRNLNCPARAYSRESWFENCANQELYHNVEPTPKTKQRKDQIYRARSGKRKAL